MALVISYSTGAGIASRVVLHLHAGACHPQVSFLIGMLYPRLEGSLAWLALQV